MSTATGPRPLLIAHRGSHGPGLPENTLPAFDAAVAAGAEMVELDVRRTADGALVIFHDPLCGRTPLDTLTHPQLVEASGIEVPTLQQTLAWALAAGMPLDVELKEDGYVGTVAALLLEFAAAGGSLLVTSFTDAVLAQVPSELSRGLLLSFTALAAGSRATQCGAGALVVEHKLLSDAVYADAQANQLDLYVWDYLPDRDGPGAAADRRLAGVITDDIPGAIAARQAASSAV
jgi:glycerophosphoryl diester phosphodiesterase